MKTNIHELLDNYFAGETSAEEEKTLRRYFAQENLPEDLQELAPIFAYLEDETAALAILDEIRREETASLPKPKRLRTLVWTIAAVAASLLIGVVLLNLPTKKANIFAENCVWINGKRITDPEVVRECAEKSFEKVKAEENILEKQLSFMFE